MFKQGLDIILLHCIGLGAGGDGLESWLNDIFGTVGHWTLPAHMAQVWAIWRARVVHSWVQE